MMTCKDIAERADAMLDGELSRWQTLQIHLHLALCKGCTPFMGQMRTTRSLIQQASQANAQDPLQPADDVRVTEILTRL